MDKTLRLWRETLPDGADELRRWLDRATNASIGTNNQVVFEH
jgi:hypothetical protein